MLERELFSLLEGTADAAFTVDQQGMICSWNGAAEKLFGYTSVEVLDKPCADLFQGRGALGTMVCTDECEVQECVAARREVPNYDLEVRARSGNRIWVNVSILVFQAERNGRRLIVHLARDIAGQKKSEKLTQTVLMAARQLAAHSEDPARPAPVSPLTEQERKVLSLLAEGKSPKDVAQQLGIAPRTLRNHVHHVNQKLRTKNRLEAVMHAIRRGLI
ncbi:MAG: PAS domain S-box protein [Acidobacteria bacterium]|nr:PAS domain S-box protein [Acidobacteriota bacterium]